MVLSMGSIAVALTGFIWMAIVPVAIINLIVSFMATLEEENNGGTGTTRLIFIIHLIIAMFLIRNVTD